jgi:hypothetical protein
VGIERLGTTASQFFLGRDHIELYRRQGLEILSAKKTRERRKTTTGNCTILWRQYWD